MSTTPPQPWLRPDQIVTSVAEWTGTPKKDLLSPNKISGRASMARYLLWAAMRAEGMSYPEIGRFVGRHHASVLATLRANPPNQAEVAAVLGRARQS